MLRRHALTAALAGVIVLAGMTGKVGAAEKYSAGTACTSDENKFDWDTAWDCVSSALQRAPLIIGSNSDTCDSNHSGEIQWTGSAFQVCNGSSWALTLTSTGSVGIGTTSPNTTLELFGAGTGIGGYGEVYVGDSSSMAQDVGGTIRFGGNDGTVTNRGFGTIGGFKENGTSPSSPIRPTD